MIHHEPGKMRWPEDFINQVICGDCLEVMKEIPDGAVDLVVTSPPWNVNKDYGGASDMRDDYRQWLKLIVGELYRIATIALYIFIAGKHSDYLRSIMPGFVQWLYWHRPNIVSPNVRLPWIPTITQIAMAWVDGRKPMLTSGSRGMKTFDLIIAASPQRNFSGEKRRIHVTQDPVDAYKPLIARTPGHIVFDPFVGSGTTLIAAKQLGRQFVGIEILQDNCHKADDRLRQGELFNQ